MAVDVELNNITSGYNTSKLNTNFQRIEEALVDGLSRSGNGPNQMNADLDMNGNDILNLKTLQVNDLTIDGTNPAGILERALDAVDQAEAAAEAAQEIADDLGDIDAAVDAAEAAAASATAAIASVTGAVNYILLEPTRNWMGYVEGQAITLPPRSVIGRIDEFIEMMISEGVWAELDVFQLYAVNGGLINMKAPGTFTATAVDSPSYTQYKGYTGVGTGHLLTGYAPSALTLFTQNDAHTMVAVEAKDTNPVLSSTSGIQNLSTTPSYNGGNVAARLNNSTGAAGAGVGNAGIIIANRNSSDTYNVKMNDVQVVTASQTSEVRHATAMCLLRSGGVYSTSRVMAHSIGGALTLDQQEAYYSFLQALLIDLGAYE